MRQARKSPGALHHLHQSLKDKQNRLLATKEFLLAITDRLETEHQKLEALVTTLKSPPGALHHGRQRRSNGH